MVSKDETRGYCVNFYHKMRQAVVLLFQNEPYELQLSLVLVFYFTNYVQIFSCMASNVEYFF